VRWTMLCDVSKLSNLFHRSAILYASILLCNHVLSFLVYDDPRISCC